MAESEKKMFVYQGHIHSKDFGKFQLTRQGRNSHSDFFSSKGPVCSFMEGLLTEISSEVYKDVT